MAVLTDKQQPFIGSIGIGGMTIHRACFARVVGIHLNSHRTMQERLIGDHAVQLSKAPFGEGCIGTALLSAGLFAPFAFCPFTDMGQVFQADEAMGGVGRRCVWTRHDWRLASTVSPVH